MGDGTSSEATVALVSYTDLSITNDSRSGIGFCLLSGFRVPVQVVCVAVDVSVGRETRLSARLGLVHGGA